MSEIQIPENNQPQAAALYWESRAKALEIAQLQTQLQTLYREIGDLGHHQIDFLRQMAEDPHEVTDSHRLVLENGTFKGRP